MANWIPRKPKHYAAIIILLYGAYLLKTALGINILNNYSAAGVFKVPLEPLWQHKAVLCSEYSTLCTWRNKIRHKIDDRIRQVKHLV